MIQMAHFKPSQRRFWRSIQGELILLLLVLLIPSLLLQAYAFYDSLETRRREELQANLEIARSVAETFDAFVQDVLHQELAMGLAVTSSRSMPSDDIIRLFQQVQVGQAAVRDFSWMNRDGLMLYSSNPAMVGWNNSDRAYFRDIAGGRDWTVGELVLARTTGKPVFGISRGIRDEQGALLGVVVATVVPERLDALLAVERGKGGGISIVDHQGMLVYRYPAIQVTWEERNWLKQYPEYDEVFRGREISKTFYAHYEGKKRIASLVPIASIGWAAGAGRTEEVAFEAVTFILLPEAALYLFVTLAAFGAALGLSRFISTPLERLRNHALALGRGEKDDLAQVSGPTELRDLADAFSMMAEEVRRRESEIISLAEDAQKRATEAEEAKRIIEAIMDAVPAVIWLAHDPECNSISGNRKAYEILGMEPGSNLLQSTSESEQPVPFKVLKDGEEIPFGEHPLQRAARGKEIHDYEFELRFDNSDSRHLFGNAAPLINQQGEVYGAVAAFMDITRRKQAEEELLAQAAELEAVFASQNDVLLIYDTKMKVKKVNPSFLSIYGFDPVGLNVKEIIRRVSCRLLDGRPLVLEDQPTPRALQGEKVAHACFLVTRSDGTEAVVETSSGPMVVGELIIGSVTVWHDITEIKRAEEALRESESRFRLLSETAGRLLAAESPQEIVTDLCRQVMEHLDCHACFNFLVDDDTGRLRLNACSGIPEEEIEKIEWLENGAAIRGCEAPDGREIVANAIVDATGPRAELLRSYGIQAYACHPLVAQGRVIGTLSFGTKNRPHFTPRDLVLMKTVADQVAVAIERMKLVEELKKSRDELEIRVQERTAELLKANEEISDLYNLAPCGYHSLGPDGAFLRINDTELEWLGYTRDEVIGKKIWSDLLTPTSLKTFQCNFPIFLKQAWISDVEYELIRKDGTVLPVLLSASAVTDAEGSFLYTRSTIFDITERKLTEAALRESEERYRMLFNQAHDAIHVLELTPEGDYGKFIEVNDNLSLMLGYTKEELQRLSLTDVVAPEHHGDLMKAKEKLLNEKHSLSERILVTKDGQRVPVEVGSHLFDYKGQSTVLSIARDITERKKAEESLRQSTIKYQKLSQQFDALLMAISDTLVLISPDMRVTWTNNRPAYHLDQPLTALSGRPYCDLFCGRPTPCEDCPVAACFRTGEEATRISSDSGRFLDKRAFPIVDGGKVASVLLLISDITEKMTLQAEAMRASHLASLGELAAGVAHEINNPINGIINYAQILINECRPESLENDIGKRIAKEGDRVADIVKSLLSFSRGGREDKRPACIDAILKEALVLTQAQIRKESIRLDIHLPDDLPEIEAHFQQIQQVFLNIINNARYALNQKYPARNENKIIEISGERVSIDAREYVRVTFLDRGEGIPAEKIPMLTKPFFSTKPFGKGTGLGLAITNRIITEHGGQLTFESAEGEFTRATIDLPTKGAA